MAEEGLGGGLFDDLTMLHNGHVIGDLRDHGEIVRDEEHGEIVGPAQVVEELQDLGLNGDIEGGGGLVGDEQAGTVDEGHRDEDALALAAGELVGIVADAALGVGQADFVHGVQHFLLDRAAGEFGVVGLERFGDLGSDAHRGVEGGHWFLKDHGDAAAPMAAHGFVREGEQGFARECYASTDVRRRRKETEDGERGGGLAGAGLAHQTERLSRVDMERDAVDGGVLAEGYGEVANVKQGRGVHCLYGSEIGVFKLVDGAVICVRLSFGIGRDFGLGGNV